MIEDISELKVNQAVMANRQEQTDTVIAEMQKSLQLIQKGGYIFLGVYIANSMGAGDAAKIMIKALAGG